jgi:RTA1 like protein
VFFTAALYLTLARVIMHYGPQNSRLTPKAYTITFMCSDFIALVLQSAGGGIADQGSNQSTRNSGVHLMVAGLSFQVLSILIFMALCAEFFWRVKKDRKQVVSNLAPRDATSRHLKIFLYGIFLSSPLFLMFNTDNGL